MPQGTEPHLVLYILLLCSNQEIITYFTDSRRWKPAGCPVYYAVYYRNMHALRLLLRAMGEEALACLTARDSTGMSALQVAASSKASGFARFFARLISIGGHTIEQPEPAVADMLGLSKTVSDGQWCCWNHVLLIVCRVGFFTGEN